MSKANASSTMRCGRRTATGHGGRAACRFCRELRQHAMQAGLDVVSFDHVSRRVMLAPRSALAMAA